MREETKLWLGIRKIVNKTTCNNGWSSQYCYDKPFKILEYMDGTPLDWRENLFEMVLDADNTRCISANSFSVNDTACNKGKERLLVVCQKKCKGGEFLAAIHQATKFCKCANIIELTILNDSEKKNPNFSQIANL